MAIVGKKSSLTLLQRFRLLTEGLLMEVAQEAMLRQYPNTGAPPPHKTGLIYTLLRIFFLPGFRLTPWPLRRRLMSLFFVHQPPPWPAQSRPQGQER